jgi:hypothetical protein
MNKLDIFFWGSMLICDVMFAITWFLPSLKDNDIYLITNVTFFFFAIIMGMVKFGIMPIAKRISQTSKLRYTLNRTDITDSEKIKLLDELTNNG